MADKKTVWITYAWADNQNDDVDFIAQELENAGLKVKLDRWTIKAGHRLWPQIEEFIQSPDQCDAWLMIATQNSLGSEPCKEEYAYALDRALRTRGAAFPVLALFAGTADSSIIPAGIRTRLHVSVRDPDWKERIVAAVEGRDVEITRKQVAPYFVAVHEIKNSGPGDQRLYAIEMRPRAGTWAPFFVGVPQAESEQVQPYILRGPAGRPPEGGILLMPSEWTQNGLVIRSAGEEATPTMSYFLFCRAIPSRIIFGVPHQGQPQFEHRLR